MPLVRIDVTQGRSPQELRQLADVVQEVMEDVFAAPPRDRYQVVTEHPAGQVICQDTGLGLERTDDLVVLQVFQQGRTQEQKKALYATLAQRLQERCGLAPSDLVVSLTANDPEDWSFGMGRAQFLEGDL
ncbi:tautomerase family protein [Pseudokineococcus sp. 1T1Z-3]|uniref:tautomerase family protein n=1 Tax=Pseudokineococcus sp. 1T1Z-3 TaxID=3132745 RepID=UPI0030B79D55